MSYPGDRLASGQYFLSAEEKEEIGRYGPPAYQKRFFEAENREQIIILLVFGYIAVRLLK